MPRSIANTNISSKRKCLIIGATGVAGQQFVEELAEHPWFEISGLGGSPRSAGKTYQEALTDTSSGAGGWFGTHELPPKIAQMPVENSLDLADPARLSEIDLVFTAVETAAGEFIGQRFAQHKPTFATDSFYRMCPDVPLFIPAINADHLQLIATQQKNRGWQGFLLPIPNCTVYGLATSLAPIHREHTVTGCIVTSLQAVSGAGRNGGVLALDIADNYLPYIAGEEEKVEKEAQKILGHYHEGTIIPANFRVSASCHRIPVLYGHGLSIFVQTAIPCPSLEAVRALYTEFKNPLAGLPSAPANFFCYHQDPLHPRPRPDRDREGGMATHIGRLRHDPVLHGIKYHALSHNTKAGAAKGALLVAEYLMQTGHF